MTYPDNIPLTDRIDHSKSVPREALKVHIISVLNLRVAVPTEVDCPATELAHKVPRDNAPSPTMHARCVGE